MNFLIAPDSFKGSLSAADVADSIKRAILNQNPEEQVVCAPMADGGEGLVDTIVNSCNGKIMEVEVKDPLMRDITAKFGLVGETAIVEMATASGIELIDDEELDPLVTTTYGTGQLIKAALDKGCRKIIIGLGGSATNDGGAGMASALGVRFLDKNKTEIGFGGGVLNRLAKIDMSGLDPRLQQCQIIGACDVVNTLTGKNGASRVYGPQKGASPFDIEKLDNNLEHYSTIIERDLKMAVRDIPGSGAAGGLGAGIMAFLNARLEKGFQIVNEMTGLEEKIIKADIVITGEGKIDNQSLSGKVVSGIGQLAQKHGKPLIVITGSIGDGAEKAYDHGVTAVFSIMDKPMSLTEAMDDTAILIERCVTNIYRVMSIK